MRNYANVLVRGTIAHLAPEASTLVRNERAAKAKVELTAGLVHANTHSEGLVHILVHGETDLFAIVLSGNEILSIKLDCMYSAE